jgi:hypothetical protein
MHRSGSTSCGCTGAGGVFVDPVPLTGHVTTAASLRTESQRSGRVLRERGREVVVRWSHLRQLVKELWDPALDLDIHCAVERGTGGPPVGRYWITLDREKIWEAPQRASEKRDEERRDETASEVTAVLREYLDTPKDELFEKRFEGDRWELTNVLKAADRRIGKRRLGGFLERFGPLHPACRIASRRGGTAAPE